MKQNHNIITSLLHSLGVKFVLKTTVDRYEQHPYKNTLYGISSILSLYNVENKGVKLADKEEIVLLSPPFIAQFSNDFVLIKSISPQNVVAQWDKTDINVPIKSFQDGWSGIVLIAEPNKDSIEPNYAKNRFKSISNLILKILLWIGVMYIGTTMINYTQLKSIPICLLLTLNLIGIYICVLLILKQIHIQNRYADKICSLFKQSDCNGVLDTPAAKLFGIIGFGEIGFGYFAANLIIMLYTPILLPYAILTTILSLPFTIWSISYQAFKVKQWCGLCVLVQIILWLLFIVALSFAIITLPDFDAWNIAFVISIYSALILLTNIGVAIWGNYGRYKTNNLGFYSLKMDEDVFATLLKKQKKYCVDINTSDIIFGNRSSKILVTILTNPHCNPCSKMHKRVEKLVEDTAGNICVQYIFSSFNEQLEQSAKCLIYIYQHYCASEAKKLYCEWFDNGKMNTEQFCQKYGYIQDECVATEFEKHKQWKEEANLNATPTILVNGYVLPDTYEIEDLFYFMQLEVNNQ